MNMTGLNLLIAAGSAAAVLLLGWEYAGRRAFLSSRTQARLFKAETPASGNTGSSDPSAWPTTARVKMARQFGEELGCRERLLTPLWRYFGCLRMNEKRKRPGPHLRCSFAPSHIAMRIEHP